MGRKFTELARAERLDTQILGRLSLEKGSGPAETFLCNTINISTSGALVETGSMIPVGSLIRYTVSLPGSDRAFEITGEVVRGERRPQQPPGARQLQAADSEPRKLIRYGIMFLDLKEEDRRAIDVYYAHAMARRQEAARPGRGPEQA